MLKGDAVAGVHALYFYFCSERFATCPTSLIVLQSIATNTAFTSGVFSVSQLTRDIPTSKDSGEQITEATLCFDDSPRFG